MKAEGAFELCFALLLWVLSQPIVASGLPYASTWLFNPPGGDYLAFALQPVLNDSSQYALQVFDFTNRQQKSGFTSTTLLPTLPFLTQDHPTAFVPFVDGTGTLNVYAGNCSAGATGAALWSLSFPNSSHGAQATWKQQALINQAGQAGGGSGPEYLATGISFSASTNMNQSFTALYSFGGMCSVMPGGWTSGNETSSSSYYNSLLRISPKPSLAVSQNSTFLVQLATTRAPPIAQAGHTMTALVPTYSNRSDGTQAIQQGFVLLGGNTQTAFINMSQIALFSLPQESWTFFNIQSTLASAQSGSSPQLTTAIQPRSGHTAVLSEDGTQIVVFGGWVGDTNTAASPQLAVLNVGAGYGGKASWSWTVPSVVASSLAPTAGVYGHGATLLPGNIMMILGGYSIGSASSSQNRRSAAQATSTGSQVFFFNLTANTWIAQYEAPDAHGPAVQNQESTPAKKHKVGLAIGLTFALLPAIALAILIFWRKRRSAKRRAQREAAFQQLNTSREDYIPEMRQTEGSTNRSRATNSPLWYVAKGVIPSTSPEVQRLSIPPPWQVDPALAADRALLLGEDYGPAPPLKPRVIVRRPRLSSPKSENGEVNEEDKLGPDEIRPVSKLQAAPEYPRSSALLSDPFDDRHERHSSPIIEMLEPSPETSVDETQEWVETCQAVEWNVGDDAKQVDYIRPLSIRSSLDKSVAQAAKRNSISILPTGMPIGVAHTLPYRSSMLLHSSAGRHGGSQDTTIAAIAEEDEEVIVHAPLTPQRPIAPHPNSSSSESQYSTDVRMSGANRSIITENRIAPIVQASHREIIRTEYAALRSADTQSVTYALNAMMLSRKTSHSATNSASPTRSMGSGGRSMQSTPTGTASQTGTWVGNVRRAFGKLVGPRSASALGDLPRVQAPASQDSIDTFRAGRPYGQMSSRRTRSDLGVWRSIRGAGDWDYVPTSPPESKSPSPVKSLGESIGMAGSMSDMVEADWDVEDAAMSREVQLAFTVPKEKLRVVNIDADSRSLASMEEARLAGRIREGKMAVRMG